MSLYVVIREKLQNIITRLNDDLSTGNKSVNTDEMFSTFEMFNDNSYGEFIEKLESSQESEIEAIMNQFNSFDEEKKTLIVLVMEVISKMGRIHEHSDVEKQVIWYNKLNNALTEK